MKWNNKGMLNTYLLVLLAGASCVIVACSLVAVLGLHPAKQLLTIEGRKPPPPTPAHHLFN